MSLTSDVDESEHVDNKEEDDVLCSLLSAHFNSAASGTVGEAHTGVGVERMDESTSEKACNQLSHNSSNEENPSVEKPFAHNLLYQFFTPFVPYIPHDHLTGQCHAPQQFSCEVCHEYFTQQYDLQVHMRTHAGDKQYDLSNKQFISSADAERHMLTHTGNKPFSCNVCYKRFTQSYNLKRHMLIHTGSKLISCNVCHKQFARSCSLKLHMLTHTGNKPFSCNVCHKRFTQRGSLTEHMRIHTGEKPFSCDVCHKRFTRKKALGSHRFTHSK